DPAVVPGEIAFLELLDRPERHRPDEAVVVEVRRRTAEFRKDVIERPLNLNDVGRHIGPAGADRLADRDREVGFRPRVGPRPLLRLLVLLRDLVETDSRRHLAMTLSHDTPLRICAPSPPRRYADSIAKSVGESHKADTVRAVC